MLAKLFVDHIFSSWMKPRCFYLIIKLVFTSVKNSIRITSVRTGFFYICVWFVHSEHIHMEWSKRMFTSMPPGNYTFYLFNFFPKMITVVEDQYLQDFSPSPVGFLWCPLTYQIHANRSIGYAKFPLGLIKCVCVSVRVHACVRVYVRVCVTGIPSKVKVHSKVLSMRLKWLMKVND